MKQKLEGRVAELERRLAEQMGQEDTAGEVRGTQTCFTAECLSYLYFMV